MTQTPEQREQAAERRECELFYKWLRAIAMHRRDDIGRTAQELITLLECEACAKAMNYDSRAYREWRHMIEDAVDAKRKRRKRTPTRKADRGKAVAKVAKRVPADAQGRHRVTGDGDVND